MLHKSRFRVPSGFRVIEITRIVLLQPHGEFVEMFCHLMVIIKRTIPIDLTVAIEVVQLSDLIAARDEDDVVTNDDTQWLKQPTCDPRPRQFRQIRINAARRELCKAPGDIG